MDISVLHMVEPEAVRAMSTSDLRSRFLVPSVFEPGALKLSYCMQDRMIVGGAVPTDQPIALTGDKKLLASDTFCQRRELGVINLGGPGTIVVDGETYALGFEQMLYVGRGAAKVELASDEAGNPARFYLCSLPAHASYPTTLGKIEDANRVELGDKAHANERTIFQFIHEDGIKSCQLVMGFTRLAEGSVWNTMPAHTHLRRSEAYMYYGLDDDNVVFHYMGEGAETRHLVMRTGDVAISPVWSIHAGSGTSNYSFVWAMGGENQAFTDMDHIPLSDML